MTPRILSAGDRALLVQADDLESTLTVAALLRQEGYQCVLVTPPHVEEHLIGHNFLTHV